MAALNGHAAQTGRRAEGPPDTSLAADREANTCTVCLENECDIVFQVTLTPETYPAVADGTRRMQCLMWEVMGLTSGGSL